MTVQNTASAPAWGGKIVRMIGLTAVALMIANPVTSADAAGKKRPPLGYQLMCLKYPDECRGGGAASIELTSTHMSTLKSVNARVNRSIRPKADGRTDTWSINVSSGDCEDYVLAKRRALIKAGFPPSALRIAHVKTRRGEGHAVLVVKTGSRDLVLDNLTGAIKPLNKTGYRVLSVSGSNPTQWS
jgi:predicted transglutaminase-like cysteine proteinase